MYRVPINKLNVRWPISPNDLGGTKNANGERTYLGWVWSGVAGVGQVRRGAEQWSRAELPAD